MLKKAVSGVPCLRRSGYAQAGRYFSVLTYWKYASRVKRAAALLDDFFDHSRRLLILNSSTAYRGFFTKNIQQAWKTPNRPCIQSLHQEAVAETIFFTSHGGLASPMYRVR